MKKFGLLVMPIMTMSLLAGCGNKPTGKDGTIIYGNIIAGEAIINSNRN